jgi:hypothetical protein
MTDYGHPGITWVGLNADKPAAGLARRFAYCTDTGKLWYDNGSTWTHVLYDFPTLKIAGNAVLNATRQFAVGLIPDADNTYLIGGTSNRWNAAYIAGMVKAGWLKIDGTDDIVISSLNVAQNLHGCYPEASGTRDCGSTSLKWANMWTVVDHVGDTIFENNMRITESEKLGMGKGLAFLSKKGKVLMVLDNEGNLKISGKIGALHGVDRDET